MKQITLALLLSALPLCALPLGAAAQDATPGENEPFFEGLDELAEGMRNLLEGFQNDVAPMMDDLTQQLRGLNSYHPPEMLPNGDIIIRRKTPKDPPKDAPEQGPKQSPDLPEADTREAIDI